MTPDFLQCDLRRSSTAHTAGLAARRRLTGALEHWSTGALEHWSTVVERIARIPLPRRMFTLSQWRHP